MADKPKSWELTKIIKANSSNELREKVARFLGENEGWKAVGSGACADGKEWAQVVMKERGARNIWDSIDEMFWC